jgi:hypothetical protein
MSCRHRKRIPELTSLLDTMFILVFAALIQAQAGSESEAAAEEAAAEEEPFDAGAEAEVGDDAGAAVPDAGAEELAAQAERERIARSTARFVGAIRNQETILVVVSGEGYIASITRHTPEETLPPEELRIKLLRDSENPDIRLVYRGREGKENRVCEITRRELGLEPDLGRAVVVITTDRPLDDLPYSLVTGLQDDAAACFDDANGLGILVDPGKANLP